MDSGYCKIKIITNCSNKRNVVTEEMRNTANYSNSLVD